MRAFTILLIAMVLAPVPHRAYADSVNDSGGGFLSYNHKEGDEGLLCGACRPGRSVLGCAGSVFRQARWRNRGRPYVSKDYAEAALKKLPECKGGEASEFEGKKHGKK